MTVVIPLSNDEKSLPYFCWSGIGNELKIGILTLVNQLNYGGVLQAYALQRVLRDLGYDAEVIDYWLSPYKTPLVAGWKSSGRPLCRRISNLFREFLGENLFFGALQRRRIKTQNFIQAHIRMSPVAYRTPEELSTIKGYEVIIVGSDQVWNYQWFGHPNPFLLEHISDSIRRISYAASFGFKVLPPEYLEEYRRGLSKFVGIGVREKEGVSLVSEWTGRKAEWVLDPTLLMPRESWSRLAGERRETGQYIFCYWLGDFGLLRPVLSELVQKLGVPVRLYINAAEKVHAGAFFRRMAGDFCDLLNRDVQIVHDAGPIEFLSALRDAEYILSDSFHAMMFSVVFEKKTAILVDSSEMRRSMTARMVDFAEMFGCSQMLIPDARSLSAASFAVPSFEVERMLATEVRHSLSFLAENFSCSSRS